MKSPAVAIAAAWDRWVFRDGSPYDLAAARIVFSLYTLWVLLSRDLAGNSGLADVYWRFVPRSAMWRYLVFPGQGSIEHALQALAVVSLVAAALGIVPRVSLLLSALLLYHLAPLENIIWNTNAIERGFEVAILALVILAFAPCADVWSVGRRSGDAPAPSWRYHWPLLLLQVFIVQIYFLAGLHKLHHSGLAWMGADNMRRWLLGLSLYEPTSVHRSLAAFMAARPALCLMSGVGTVALELSFPIVLFARASRRLWIPAALVMHVGIIYSMNIFFINAPQLLSFVNWDWLRQRVTRPRSPAPAAVMSS